LKLALRELAGAIDRSASSEEAAVAATNEALKNRELKDFATQLPEAREQLAKVAESVKNQMKETKARVAAEKAALAQLQEALGKMNL
jgi:hypothetical protein